MDFSNQIILISGVLLLVSILASMLSSRVGMPLLLVFLGIGMLVGEEGIGGIVYHDVQSAHLIGNLALALILFDGGLRTETASFRVGLRPALLLATVGVVITAGVTGLFVAWMLEVDLLQGLLVGAIIGSTDAAAVFALLRAQGLTLKQRVGATLEIESGANDPMAVFLTITLIEIITSGEGFGWAVGVDFIYQMGVGAAAGLVIGRGLAWLINHLEVNPSLYPLAAMAGALLIFGGTGFIGGSGFLAVYLAGLVLGNRPLRAGTNIGRFHDGMAWLGQIGMFLVLGLLVTPSALLAEAPKALLVAAALMLVARPLAVLVCLLPFRFPWREQVYVGWMGLRGAVPIVLALFPLLAGMEHAVTIFNIAFFVVLISLLVQGWTVAPAARWLGLEVPPTPGAMQRVELDIPGQADFELVGYHLGADSPMTRRGADRLPLPAHTRVATVIRGGQALETCDLGALLPDDYVYMVASRQELSALDRLFAPVHAPARLEEHRFFGEFVIHGDALIDDLAAVYGFTPPEDALGRSVSDYLTARFNRRPVVGDRVSLDEVELVVRELADGVVSRVGLKLGHAI